MAMTRLPLEVKIQKRREVEGNHLRNFKKWG